MNILDRILETKRAEVAAARTARPFEAIHAEARAVTRAVISFSGALRTSPTGIIAEFKRRSPSKGFINEQADVAEVTSGYAAAGAAAISVLTDREYFAGSLDDLRAARRAVDGVTRTAAGATTATTGGVTRTAADGASTAGVPLLRKDFVVDEYQLCEARLAGADAVLLIAAAITADRCRELAAFAAALGLEALLELHDASELGHICPGVSVVGVNNRNLGSFSTDTAVSERLGSLLPDGMVRISESGISAPETVLRLRAKGFSGFLMGENFMKRTDPAAALSDFINALRP